MSNKDVKFSNLGPPVEPFPELLSRTRSTQQKLLLPTLVKEIDMDEPASLRNQIVIHKRVIKRLSEKVPSRDSWPESMGDPMPKWEETLLQWCKLLQDLEGALKTETSPNQCKDLYGTFKSGFSELIEELVDLHNSVVRGDSQILEGDTSSLDGDGGIVTLSVSGQRLGDVSNSMHGGPDA